MVIATCEGVQALEEWSRVLAVRSTNTARTYLGAAAAFVNGCGKPLSRIGPREYAQHCAQLARSGRAPATVAHHITAVRAFIRYCQESELTAAFTLDLVRRPQVTVTSTERYLTQEEALRLLAAAKVRSPQAHLAVSLLVLTGVRVGELARAQWRDIFQDAAGNIGLTVLGKSRKQRTVLLKPDLWVLLNRDRARRGLGTDFDRTDRAALLAKGNGTAYTTAGLWKLVRVCSKTAGLKQATSPHWLRHTYGTLAAQAGASVFQIQRDLGHADISTSQRYVHWAHGLEDSAAHLLPLATEPSERRDT